MHRGYQSDFRPMASERSSERAWGTNDEQGRGETQREGRIHTAFHDGVELCMTASCGGGSFRVWESHACHSAGTCDALRSCYSEKKERERERRVSKISSRALSSLVYAVTVDSPGQSRPSDDDLAEINFP